MSGDILQFREFINTAPYADFTDGVAVANDPYGNAVFVQENETGAGPDHINLVNNVVATRDLSGQGIVPAEFKYGAYSYVGPGDPLLDNGFNANIADRWVGAQYDLATMENWTLQGWALLKKAPLGGARAYMMISNSYPASGAGTSWGGVIGQRWTISYFSSTLGFVLIDSLGQVFRVGNTFGAPDFLIDEWNHILVQAKRIFAGQGLFPVGSWAAQIWLNGRPLVRGTGSGTNGTPFCRVTPSPWTEGTNPKWFGGLNDLIIGHGGPNGWSANNAYTWPGYLDGWRIDNDAIYDLACDATFDPATLALPPSVGGSALTGGKVEIGLNYPAAVAVNTGPLTKRVEIATLLAEEVPL